MAPATAESKTYTNFTEELSDEGTAFGQSIESPADEEAQEFHVTTIFAEVRALSVPEIDEELGGFSEDSKRKILRGARQRGTVSRGSFSEYVD